MPGKEVLDELLNGNSKVTKAVRIEIYKDLDAVLKFDSMSGREVRKFLNICNDLTRGTEYPDKRKRAPFFKAVAKALDAILYLKKVDHNHHEIKAEEVYSDAPVSDNAHLIPAEKPHEVKAAKFPWGRIPPDLAVKIEDLEIDLKAIIETGKEWRSGRPPGLSAAQQRGIKTFSALLHTSQTRFPKRWQKMKLREVGRFKTKSGGRMGSSRYNAARLISNTAAVFGIDLPEETVEKASLLKMRNRTRKLNRPVN
jgi:hypothetical protein